MERILYMVYLKMNISGTSVLTRVFQWYIGLVAAMYTHDVTVKSLKT